MTGYDKIAILLGELGTEASAPILARLNLNNDELTKIRKAMKNLGGKYDPWNETQVARENLVLEEYKAYGELRGIYKEIPHASFIKTGESSAQHNAREMAMADPEALAKVLGQWLKDDK